MFDLLAEIDKLVKMLIHIIKEYLYQFLIISIASLADTECHLSV